MSIGVGSATIGIGVPVTGNWFVTNTCKAVLELHQVDESQLNMNRVG